MSATGRASAIIGHEGVRHEFAMETDGIKSSSTCLRVEVAVRRTRLKRQDGERRGIPGKVTMNRRSTAGQGSFVREIDLTRVWSIG